jgi:hypothetical protein
MESTVTTDDTNANTLMNDVLKKTSLLIGVRGLFIISINENFD